MSTRASGPKGNGGTIEDDADDDGDDDGEGEDNVNDAGAMV